MTLYNACKDEKTSKVNIDRIVDYIDTMCLEKVIGSNLLESQ
jgi:hypothetical protein